MSANTPTPTALTFILPTQVAPRAGRNASPPASGAVTVSPKPQTRRQVYKPRRPTMAASPLPDDTAVDMLTFALSGPGVLAALLFAGVTGGLFLTFGQVGRRSASPQTPVYLRVRLKVPRRLEFSDGVVRNVREGESLFRFDTHEMATAVARQLEDAAAGYTLYKLDGVSVRTLASWPRAVNAPGAIWPSGVLPAADQSGVLPAGDQPDPQAIWEEYQQIGESGAIEADWKQRVDKLGAVHVTPEPMSACRLCGGSGRTRCFRCGGVSRRTGGSFVCDCVDGLRPCAWCARSA